MGSFQTGQRSDSGLGWCSYPLQAGGPQGNKCYQGNQRPLFLATHSKPAWLPEQRKKKRWCDKNTCISFLSNIIQKQRYMLEITSCRQRKLNPHIKKRIQKIKLTSDYKMKMRRLKLMSQRNSCNSLLITEYISTSDMKY